MRACNASYDFHRQIVWTALEAFLFKRKAFDSFTPEVFDSFDTVEFSIKVALCVFGGEKQAILIRIKLMSVLHGTIE